MLARKRWIFTCLVSLLWLPVHCSCLQQTQPQSEIPKTETSPDRNSISLHMVGTVGNGSLEGTTIDRRLFLLGAAYNRLLSSKKFASISFTSQVIPVAILREPYIIATDIQAFRSSPPGTEFHKNYGAGASPAGVRVNFLPGKKVQPFFGIQGGFLRFSHTALAPNASHFNFTIDGRAGLEFALRSEKAISFAYMFQHMSNAYIAKDNPGVDSHMLTLAYRFPLPRRNKSAEKNRSK
jgi:hypothetical protein